MDNARRYGAGAAQVERPDRHYTAPFPDIQRAGAAIMATLIAEADAGDLSETLRRLLDRDLRMLLAAASIWSLPIDTADQLARAAIRDIRKIKMQPLEYEAARQRDQWRRHCAQSGLRRPTLTAAERRRASTINLAASPREELAIAWEAASARDRRDLIFRATRGQQP